MNAPLPRTPLLRGRIEASGLWIDAAVLGDAKSQRRVLQLWDAQTRVLRAHGGYLVLFGGVRPLFADAAPGTALTPLPDGSHTSCALTAHERNRVQCPPGSWLHARGGRIEVTDLANLPVVDPSAWIDVGAWEIAVVQSLGPPPVRAIPEATIIREDDEHGIHALLGDKAPAVSAERTEYLASQPRGAKPDGSQRISLFERLRRLLGGVPDLDDVPVLPPAPSRSAPGGQGWLSRAFRALVMRSPLARAVGRRQAEFLERTMRLFTQGKLDEALRHAIPFSDLPGASKPPALSVPSPRASLELTASPGPGPTTSLHMGDGLAARFKSLYREAAQALEKDGRIEEAAYVYFELLADNDEGIAVLERHHKYALAASMAHGRGMVPGLVIRLWFLAKRADRALLVAKRTGAFADAIARMASAPQDALRLRLLWGDHLAQAGDYAAAVEAVWPAPAGRSLARSWVDRAIEFGGPAGARMLALKRFAWKDDPSALREADEAIGALLQREDDLAKHERVCLAEAWSQQFSKSDTHHPIVDRVARQLMLDRATPHVVDGLLTRGVDAVLADHIRRARIPEDSGPSVPKHPRVFKPDDRGLLSPTDVVILPNGQLLVALGEVGLQHIAHDGRVLRHYTAPTTTIVLAHNGRRAILLHRRGQATTLARLETDTGRHTHWESTRLEHWASSYDGSTWYVCDGNRVLGLDAQADGLEVLWSVGGLQAALGLSVDDSAVRFLLLENDIVWLYRYALTDRGPTLRSKTDPPIAEGATVVLGTDGTVASWSRGDEERQISLSIVPPAGRKSYASCSADSRHDATTRYTRQCSLPSSVVLDGRGLTYSARTSNGVTIRHLQPSDYSEQWWLEFPGSERVSCHAVGPRTVVFDALGRIVVVDPEGAIERVVRTRT